MPCCLIQNVTRFAVVQHIDLGTEGSTCAWLPASHFPQDLLVKEMPLGAVNIPVCAGILSNGSWA